MPQRMLAVALGVLLAFGAMRAVVMVAGYEPSPRFIEVFREGSELRTRPRDKGSSSALVPKFPEVPVLAADGRFRIAAFGGSSTYGIPFENYTIWGWMEMELEDRIEGLDVEMLNFGVPGICVRQILELEREIPEESFHLAIVYCGHNEFIEPNYEVFRSELHEGIVRRAARLFEDLRFVRWIGELVSGSSSTGHPRHDNSMLRHRVGSGDEREVHAFILDRAERELECFLRRLQARGVPILVLLPASNGIHIAPMTSAFAPDRSKDLREEVQAGVEKGKELFEAKELAGALSLVDRLLELTPEYAPLHGLRGRILKVLGRDEESRAALQRCEDLDLRPLWATNELRRRFRAVAEGLSIPVADMHAIFQRELEERLPLELFIDWCHPTVLGQQVIARVAVQSLLKRRVLPGAGEARGGGWKPDPEVDRVAREEERVLRLKGAVSTLTHVLQGKPQDWVLESLRESLKSSLKIVPDDSWALLCLGMVEGFLGNAGDARPYLDAAFARDPGKRYVLLEMAGRFPLVRELCDDLSIRP